MYMHGPELKMSSKIQNPNRGPISLRHDCTPRDLTVFNPDVDASKNYSLTGDFRFKGWAERDFQGWRNPVRKTKEELSLERTKLAGYPISNKIETPQLSESVHNGGLVEAGPVKSEESHPSQKSSDEELDKSKTDLIPGSPFVRDPYKDKTPEEISKLQRQMREADKDILMFKEERLRKLREETEAKRRDLEMLRNHDPWGKPGGGAPPMDGVKKKKFLEEDLTPREEPRYRQPLVQVQPQQGTGDYFADTFGRPGGGAPLKTDSGGIVTNIKGDPSIRFQARDDLRQSIENHIRYHKPQSETLLYNNELDKQIEDKKIHGQLQKLEDLKKEIDMMKHNPYGRPGAGAPNITSSDGNNTDKKQPEAGSEFDPWGKGSLQPVRNEDGTIARHRNYLSNKYTPQIRDSSNGQGTSLEMRSLGGGGAPHVGDNGQLITRLPATMNANDFGEHVIKEEVAGGVRPQTLGDKPHAYYPFGRPGAGAPRRDEEGRIVTTVNNKLTREASSGNDLRRTKAAQMYHRDLAKGMEEQQRNRKDEENYQKAPIGELASVLRDGQVGKPRRDPVTGMLLPQHLGTSDVTQLKIHDINYRAISDSKHYHDDLTKAAEERYRSRELEKMKEKQEAKNHERVFSEFWGKPGAGAPKPSGNYRKANLEDTLFAKKQNIHNAEFERYMNSHSRGPVADRDSNQKYVRSTLLSTHANQYDMESNLKRGERVQYTVNAPWASVL